MIYTVVELKEIFWSVLIIQLVIHSLVYPITVMMLLFNVKVQIFPSIKFKFMLYL